MFLELCKFFVFLKGGLAIRGVMLGLGLGLGPFGVVRDPFRFGGGFLLGGLGSFGLGFLWVSRGGGGGGEISLIPRSSFFAMSSPAKFRIGPGQDSQPTFMEF